MNVLIPLELAEAVLDAMIELRGERAWWKDEPRNKYQDQYWQLCRDLHALEAAVTKAWSELPVNNPITNKEK